MHVDPIALTAVAFLVPVLLIMVGLGAFVAVKMRTPPPAAGD